jgi:hypothetical protein
MHGGVDPGMGHVVAVAHIGHAHAGQFGGVLADGQDVA